MSNAPDILIRAALYAASHDRAPGHLRGRPLLLATDGGPASQAAARLAAELAAVRGAVPHVVRAFDTATIGHAGPLPALAAAADALVGPGVHEPDVRSVRSEIAALLDEPVGWPVHVGLGSPAGVIVRQSAALGAALVVMGLRRHGRLDRLVHDETTLNVMRAAGCPVLAATPALAALPRRVVVGVDFSSASRHAARAALGVLRDGGALVLAYVETPGGSPDADVELAEEGAVYAVGVAAAFDRLLGELAEESAARVEHVRVERALGRTVADELWALADEREADLIAVGSRRHSWIDRTFLGTVTVNLARDGRHPLLVVPPPLPPRVRPPGS